MVTNDHLPLNEVLILQNEFIADVLAIIASHMIVIHCHGMMDKRKKQF